MKSIILAFTACLTAAPAHCEGRELTFSASELNEHQCMMGAQFRLAEWASKHPKWKVTRYRCLTDADRELPA